MTRRSDLIPLHDVVRTRWLTRGPFPVENVRLVLGRGWDSHEVYAALNTLFHQRRDGEFWGIYKGIVYPLLSDADPFIKAKILSRAASRHSSSAKTVQLRSEDLTTDVIATHLRDLITEAEYYVGLPEQVLSLLREALLALTEMRNG